MKREGKKNEKKNEGCESLRSGDEEGEEKKMERAPLRGRGVTTANKEWRNERVRTGTIGGRCINSAIPAILITPLSEFASGREVMEM